MFACFRLYTEDKPVLRLIARHFDGATLFHGTGVWQGDTEAALVVEILATLADTAKVLQLAEDIRAASDQTLVIVTVQASGGFERFDVARPVEKVSAREVYV